MLRALTAIISDFVKYSADGVAFVLACAIVGLVFAVVAGSIIYAAGGIQKSRRSRQALKRRQQLRRKY